MRLTPGQEEEINILYDMWNMLVLGYERDGGRGE